MQPLSPDSVTDKASGLSFCWLLELGRVSSLALPGAASVPSRRLSLAGLGWCDELELLLGKHHSRACMVICYLSS